MLCITSDFGKYMSCYGGFFRGTFKVVEKDDDLRMIMKDEKNLEFQEKAVKEKMTKYSPDKGRGGWRVSKHEKKHGGWKSG